MSDHEIVNRLRRISEHSMFDETINETADLLEFLLDRFEPATLEINGHHRWKFSARWPWKEARGPNIEAALNAALEAQKRGMRDMTARREMFDRLIRATKENP
jgi:hypothetical protein